MKKHLLLTVLLTAVLVSSVCAKKKVSPDYEKIAREGPAEEIRQEFKENRNLKDQVFGKNRETFLMLALQGGRGLDIISLCLENESNIKAKSKDGRIPLMYAAQHSSDEAIIEALVQSGAFFKKTRKSRVLQKDKKGRTSFFYARMNPSYAVYQKLCEYAEDPDGLYVPAVQETPAAEAHEEPQEPESSSTETESLTEASQTQPQSIRPASENEAQADSPLDGAKKAEIQQYTSVFLMDFAEDESVQQADPAAPEKQLIENPDAADKNGVTLLMKAAKSGNDWDVNLLLESGADPNLRDKDGWTALMYAVRYQNSLSPVTSLIENGAYVRVRNKFNATPLLMAAGYSQNPQILSVLLRGRSISEDEVYRAFIFAITGNSPSEHIRAAKAALFLDKGIPLNRLWKGETPLMYAAQYARSTEVIQQLLEAGAKPEFQDENGKTAFDYAKANKCLPHDDVYWSLNGAS